MILSIPSRALRVPALALLGYVALCTPASYGADAAVSAFARQVKAALSPADQSWLVTEGRAASADTTISAATVKQHVSTHFAARKFDEQTIAALVAAALLEVAAKSEADSKAIAAAIDASNRLKAALRDLKDKLNDTDCADDLNQQLMAQLQQAMQKIADAEAQASSIAKSNSTAIDKIIGNIRG